MARAFGERPPEQVYTSQEQVDGLGPRLEFVWLGKRIEDQTELARALLEDLRDAADVDGPPLDAEALASLDRGLADIAAGRVEPLDEYKRQRGL